MRMLRPLLPAAVAAALALPLSAPAQDANILLPVDSIERLLRFPAFEIGAMDDVRFEGDRTQRVMLEFPGDVRMLAQWAKAPRGGAAFNNQPRYEVAAYELQKLFLEPDEYVVPPTVMRVVPLDWYRQYDRRASATFDRTASVLVALQYWLWSVTDDDFYDPDRLDADAEYARHFANFNILTYLIRHVDANQGNFLISTDPNRPRVFSVDNGVAFRSAESNRGDRWRRLRVDRLPRAAVERLRRIRREHLDRALAVLAEFETSRDGQLVAVDPGPNLDPRRGVRREDGRVQLGLTDGEIGDVETRLRRLLERVDDGRVEVF